MYIDGSKEIGQWDEYKRKGRFITTYSNGAQKIEYFENDFCIRSHMV